MATTQENPQGSSTPQPQGSPESAALLQQIMDETGMSKEEAAAALAASNRMAHQDPVAQLANALVSDVQMLREQFMMDAQQFDVDQRKAVLEAQGVDVKAMIAEQRAAAAQAGRKLPEEPVKLTPDLEKEFNERGQKLKQDLQALIHAEAEALTGAISMRDEQRKEIIWAIQSRQMAQAEETAAKNKERQLGFPTPSTKTSSGAPTP